MLKFFSFLRAKKLFILFLLPILISVCFVPGYPSCAAEASGYLLLNPIDEKTIQELGPSKLPDIAIDAISKGIQPASLKNVTLKLKSEVNWLSSDQVKIIKENAKNGTISQSLLPSVKPGMIYADPFSLHAIEFIKGDGDTLYILLADDSKIVEEISIPEQMVFLNEANITYVAQGINFTSYKKKSGNSEATGFNFEFNEHKTLTGKDENGTSVEVSLKGRLNIAYPMVEVKYTKNKGYKFIFQASQNAEIQAQLLSQIKKEVKIFLYECTILPPEQGFRIAERFYLVLGVDGKITLEYSVNQTSFIRAGLKGNTSFYIPTSVNTEKDLSFDFNSENLSLSADVKGEISLLAETVFDILGKGQFILDKKLGVLLEAKSSIQGTSGDYLSIKGDGFVKITGKIKIKSFEKSKKIYEYKYPLFNYVSERTGSYNIEIDEACAYRDVIKGRIVERVTEKPYAGKEIQLKVTGSSGSERVLTAVTDNSGYFSRTHDLKKGDTVRVKIPGTTDKWSFPREASFPFNHVVVETADFLSDTIEGYVCGSEKEALAYNGPISLYIQRSANVPLHHENDISLPVDYTIKLNAQSSDGYFKIEKADLRPYDKVYAVLENQGFVITSSIVETDGITVSMEGGYFQEPYRLSSSGSYLFLDCKGAVQAFNGEAYLQISTLYPHSADPENTLKSKEWKLNLAPVSGQKLSVASTGPWELDLNPLLSKITSPFDRLRSSFEGKRSVNYHVFETVRFYVEGKKLEYFNEAKTCEEERIGNFLNKGTNTIPMMDIIPTDEPKFFSLPNTLEKTIPLVGSIPADYYLKSLRSMVLNNEEQASAQNLPDLSPQNCSADLTINYYSNNESFGPVYSRSMKFSIFNEQQKVETGVLDPILMWDKKSKTKVVEYQEFPRKESVRYDLDDFIPELQNVPFVLKGTEQVSGFKCNVWEKSRKIDPIMNVYVKVQLFIEPNNSLPMKVVFYDGYNPKIEMLFNNWKKASEDRKKLFKLPFGEIRMPVLPLEITSTNNEETEQLQLGNGGANEQESITENTQGDVQNSRVVIRLLIGDPYMTINGIRHEIDPGRGTKPLIMEERTILPIRAVVEALGGSVSWNGDEKKVTIARQNKVIEMWVGKKEMLVNGLKVTNDVAPVIIGERTYVPVRFVAENLNCDVNWDGETRTVTLTTR